MKNVPLCFLFLLAFTRPAFATEPARPSASPLSHQYQQLLTGAEVFEGYRMLKVYEVDRLWRAVMDSIREGSVSAAAVRKENDRLRSEIKVITSTMEQKDAVNAHLEFAGKHISVFGKDLKKSSFITMVVLITSCLCACIVVLISMGKINYKACRDARKLYDELYVEFDQYRHGAVERQIKLSRELQDYRNRHADLKSA